MRFKVLIMGLTILLLVGWGVWGRKVNNNVAGVIIYNWFNSEEEEYRKFMESCLKGFELTRNVPVVKNGI